MAAVTGAYRKLYGSGQSLYNSLIQIGVEKMVTDPDNSPPGSFVAEMIFPLIAIQIWSKAITQALRSETRGRESGVIWQMPDMGF